MGMNRLTRGRMIAGSLQSDELRYTDTLITSAQLLANFTTPISVVPAPVNTDKGNVFMGALCFYAAGAPTRDRLVRSQEHPAVRPGWRAIRFPS